MLRLLDVGEMRVRNSQCAHATFLSGMMRKISFPCQSVVIRALKQHRRRRQRNGQKQNKDKNEQTNNGFNLAKQTRFLDVSLPSLHFYT